VIYDIFLKILIKSEGGRNSNQSHSTVPVTEDGHPVIARRVLKTVNLTVKF